MDERDPDTAARDHPDAGWDEAQRTFDQYLESLGDFYDQITGRNR